MLPRRDALKFEAGYRLGHSKAKEEDAEERLGGLGEAAMPKVLVEEALESSRVREARGQKASEGKGGLSVVPEGGALLNPPMGLVIDIPQSPPSLDMYCTYFQ